ncbi:sulfopyruvate decarboxylase subunit beta [Halorubrum sp. GN11_10-6_MGM]|uniref:thiamine pyrophosphate-dependent enzyme n=1 Tax=Halorubrum sp. GN11_10-6_MGM TaxID=2518112 RepID=UPI0010F4B72A|nr:thiamine pyrophosphate-dependent enzyme [Halorubrum sp. GN11_10-6_MGM]TKX74188.1 sulfopyruvate decarboxylase subunit beta [Halorubrum sp. GN11_10-6_MGM]
MLCEVLNLGVASYVLASVSDAERPRNFYQWGSMGVTTAVGLGLAISTDEPVTVLEGDGSLLMSLGTLTTVARCDPDNLTVVVWANDVYGTTGGQSLQAKHTDFAGIAENSGLDAVTVRDSEAFTDAYREATESSSVTVIVCHVDPIDPDARPPFDFPYIARRVRESLSTDSS